MQRSASYMKHLLALLFVSLGLVGCTTGKITNITPTKVQRNAAGLYPVELAWKSREHALREETLQPQVLVGTQAYPMQRTPVVRDRWEALIPVPANENILLYRFKMDYEFNTIPSRQKNSRLSPEYKLEIVDPR